MSDRWIKWRKSLPILRRVVMGLVILPPLVALPKVQSRKIAAPTAKAVEKSVITKQVHTKPAKKKKITPQ